MSPLPTQAGRFALRRADAHIAAAIVTLLSCNMATAQTLKEIVVSAGKIEQRAFDTAASVNVISREQIQEGQAQANLSESLVRVPGIFALNRQNYAQDLLISSRGFGANSAFGARGIKLFVDGIPGTVADGQGQMSHIDLASTERIEVLRGPFSVLYGNASGGVITVFTEKGKPGTDITPYVENGSFGLQKYGIKVSGEQSNINYVLDAGNLHTDGFRQHSATDRQNQNVKVGLQLGTDTTLQLVANQVTLEAQDALGLTAKELQQDPAQAGKSSVAYNTRKTMSQTQGGLVLNQRLDGNNSLVLSPYSGQRHTVQYLAGTSGKQTNGVIDLSRDFYGMDAKWQHSGQVGGLPLRVVSGIDGNQNDDHRLTDDNLAGTRVAGIAPQDLNQSAKNLDGYVQAELRPNDKLTLTAGARHSKTTLNSTNNNGNVAAPRTGSHDYDAWTSMLSALYYVRDDTNVYVSYGTSFDTPTLNQTAYTSAYVSCTLNCVNTGNLGLDAATTQQLEIGFKSEIANLGRFEMAAFTTATNNDIVVDSSFKGKTSYANAAKTTRSGFELGATVSLPNAFQASVAYTWLDAKVAQDYTTALGSLIKAGNRIPGVPNQGLYAELMWRQADQALELAIEGRLAGDMAADDKNSAFSSGYALLNARAILRQRSGAWAFTEFLRIDNVFDRAYVGSLIVNQANLQFYEPSPGRNWVLGAKATLHF